MPVTVVNEINSIVSHFYWGGNEDKRKTHWVKWEDICLPKEQGGLRCPDFKLRNVALLNKWTVRYANDDSLLWRKVVSARYGDSSKGILPMVSNSSSASWIWRTISNCYNEEEQFSSLFKNGLSLHLGDGKKMNFWKDCWLGPVPLCSLFPRVFTLSTNKDGMVADFGSFDFGSWTLSVPFVDRF